MFHCICHNILKLIERHQNSESHLSCSEIVSAAKVTTCSVTYVRACMSNVNRNVYLVCVALGEACHMLLSITFL